MFTLPGDDNFELIKGGKHRTVEKSNVMQYIKASLYLASSVNLLLVEMQYESYLFPVGFALEISRGGAS